MARWWLLSACLGALCCPPAIAALELAPPQTEARRAFEAQRTRARELIHQRAAQQAQERRERIAARKRAGISLSRPRSTGFPYQRTTPSDIAHRQASFPNGFVIR